MSVGSFYDKKIECGLGFGIDSRFDSPYNFALREILNYSSSVEAPRVLDLGCGAGEHLCALLSRGAKVTGVDLSQKSLDKCSELLESRGLSAELVCADIESYLLDLDESFDVIFMSGVLYYVNQETVYDSIYNALVSGGIFVCVETNGDNLALNSYRYFRNLFTGYRDVETMSQLLSPNSLYSLLKNTRFSVVEMKRFDILTLFIPFLSSFVKRIDKVVVRIPVVRNLCFKFVLLLKK